MDTHRLVRRGAALGAGVAAALLANRARRRRAARSRASTLLATARPVRPDRRAAADLPAPARRYLETVLPADSPTVRTATVRQRGRLRLGASASPWRRFTATHHVSVSPPGFLWDASIRLAPLCSLRILDAFEDGEGAARVSLWTLPVAGADPSPELNEAELMRYLAEAVWYPTALLGENVEWEPRDEASAEATITHGDTSASLVFHFDEEGLVSRVSTDRRYRRVRGGYEPTPWTGHWREYRTRHGIRVPTAGEVVWHLPEGDVSAWRGRVTSVSYDGDA